ncbi:hypothetical protein [Amycolatopsis vastitatis]|uniref:hypothetical protein n=1 Tax=Amycolatopsis vastitatis TaxID=1905142 RepID=UPI0011789BA3|nr:hypothetical protein [Amycolatopsis vastitatis]
MASAKGNSISKSTVDTLFSHPVAEQPRPEALTTSQDDRYGSLFLQPVYTPAHTGGHTDNP